MASASVSSDSVGNGSDKMAVARLLKETILQLCRTNVMFSGGGRVEIDGIICISGQVEGQELVVKVHEVLREAGDASSSSTDPVRHLFGNHYGHPEQKGQHLGSIPVGGYLNRRDSLIFQSSFVNDVPNGNLVSDAKRRRVDGFDAISMPPPPPHPSALYAYLSRLGYDPLAIRASSASLTNGGSGTIFGSSPSETDYRKLIAAAAGVRDLSTKSHHHRHHQTLAGAGSDNNTSPSAEDESVANGTSPSASSAVAFRAPSSPRQSCDDLQTIGVATVRPESASTYSNSDVTDLASSQTSASRMQQSGAKQRSMLSDRWLSPNRLYPPPLLHVVPSLQGGHLVNGDGMVVPQCLACGFHFDTAEAFGDHNESAHSIFTCLCCFKTFTSRSNLERHSRLHTGHRPYACPVCGKTFSRKDHLSNHATKHAYKCAACSRRCADRAALADHFRTEHGGATLAAVCSYCNKGFGSIEMFEEHVKMHPQFHSGASLPSAPGSGELRRFADESPADIPQSSSLFPRRYHHRLHRYSYDGGERSVNVNEAVQNSRNSGLVFSSNTPSLGQRIHDSSPRLLSSRYDNPSSFGAGDNGLDVAPVSKQETNLLTCSVCHQVFSTLLGLKQHEMLHLYELAEGAFRLANDRSADPVRDHKRQRFDCNHCEKKFDDYADLREHLESLAADSGVRESSVETSAALQHRVKRKQKQPKPLVQVDGDEVAEDGEDEDVNVVSPEAVVDSRTFQNDAVSESDDERINYDERSMVDAEEQSDSSPAAEIKMEPIRSIMNRSAGRAHRERCRTEVHDQIVNGDNESGPTYASASASPLNGASTTSDVDGNTLMVQSIGGRWPNDGGHLPPPAKRVTSVDDVAHSDGMPRLERQSLTSSMKATVDGCLHPGTVSQENPDELVVFTNNNNNGIVKNENGWSESPGLIGAGMMMAPGGVQRCVVCGLECADFNDLETHCVTEHSRSPCMFCSKTFAQKANRDRHVCLHTGDRPYGCPECGERFSRGDKLKMHRVRTHGVLYPLYGSRGGHHRSGAAGNRSSASPSSSSYAGDLGAYDVIGGGDADSSSGGQDQDSCSPSEMRIGSGPSWMPTAGSWSDHRADSGIDDPPSLPWNLVRGNLVGRFPKMENLGDEEARDDIVSGSA